MCFQFSRAFRKKFMDTLYKVKRLFKYVIFETLGLSLMVIGLNNG